MPVGRHSRIEPVEIQKLNDTQHAWMVIRSLL